MRQSRRYETISHIFFCTWACGLSCNQQSVGQKDINILTRCLQLKFPLRLFLRQVDWMCKPRTRLSSHPLKTSNDMKRRGWRRGKGGEGRTCCWERCHLILLFWDGIKMMLYGEKKFKLFLKPEKIPRVALILKTESEPSLSHGEVTGHGPEAHERLRSTWGRGGQRAERGPSSTLSWPQGKSPGTTLQKQSQGLKQELNITGMPQRQPRASNEGPLQRFLSECQHTGNTVARNMGFAKAEHEDPISVH